MAKFGAKISGGIPGIVNAECNMEYDCKAQKGEGKCSSCNRTISLDTIMIGQRSSGDHCFYDNVAHAVVNLSYNERHLIFPSSSEHGQYVITEVSIWDCYKNGKGGTVQIVSGGVGQNHVRVKFMSSSIMSGYHFQVAIYGRRVR